MNTQEKVAALESIIEEARNLLIAARKECTHETGTYMYKSNSGNYDPSSDCYWRENRCSDCGAYWHEDSEIGVGNRNPMYTQDPGPNWKEVRTR